MKHLSEVTKVMNLNKEKSDTYLIVLQNQH